VVSEIFLPKIIKMC